MLNRRELLFGASALALGKPAPARPNIFVILADDVPSWVLGSSGGKEFQTPNLDRMAKAGMRFPFNYAASPIASENRRALLGGLQNAVQKYGYQISEMAKAPDAGASFASVTSAALGFLSKQAPGQPFVYVAAYPACSNLGDSVDEKFRSPYANAKFENLGWEPASSSAVSGKEQLRGILPSLRKYGAGLSALDAEIPKLQQGLFDKKLTDTTVVLFASSGGQLLGRHGAWGQGDATQPENWYEESVALPSIWNWPGRVPADSYRPELVSVNEYEATFHDIVGAPYNGAGRSFLTLLENKQFPKKQPWKEVVTGRSGNSAMARDQRFKLVLRDGGKTPGELYDVRNDPREKSNQYANSSFISVRQALTKAIG